MSERVYEIIAAGTPFSVDSCWFGDVQQTLLGVG